MQEKMRKSERERGERNRQTGRPRKIQKKERSEKRDEKAEEHAKSLLWPHISVVSTYIVYCGKCKRKVFLDS